MSSWRPLIAASILTGDFGHLDRVVRKLERAGVDRLHLDVMDGHFVPNLTFGPDIVAAFRRLTPLPLDVHLMIAQPAVYTPRFLEASPDSITFHVEVAESDETKGATLQAIRESRCAAGLAVSPGTRLEAVRPFIGSLDVIMVMTVEPGFGGQRFITDAAAKMRKAGEWLRVAGTGGMVHVDGGVNRDTAREAGFWGAEVCVVGSALFQRGQDASDEVRAVKERATEGRRQAEATEDAALAVPASVAERRDHPG